WDWNMITGEVHFSPALLELYRLSPEEMIDTKTALSLVHPDDRAAVVAVVNRSVAEGTPFVYDTRLLLSDGTECITHNRGEMVCDKESKPVRMIGIAQNITERRKAEEALKTEMERSEFERSRLRTMLEFLPVGVTIADMQGKVLQVNQEAMAIWGQEAPLAA